MNISSGILVDDSAAVIGFNVSVPNGSSPTNASVPEGGGGTNMASGSSPGNVMALSSVEFNVSMSNNMVPCSASTPDGGPGSHISSGIVGDDEPVPSSGNSS